jgi:hypothetical protein
LSPNSEIFKVSTIGCNASALLMLSVCCDMNAYCAAYAAGVIQAWMLCYSCCILVLTKIICILYYYAYNK